MTEAVERVRDVTPGHQQGRSAAQIEADIERARARLAGTLDQIVEHAKPRNMAERGVAKARERLSGVTGQFVTEEGKPRLSRVAPAAGGVALVAAFLVWRARRC